MNLFFISLGCDKNLVDSEHIIGAISKGVTIVDDIDEADVIAINTCCFIEASTNESIETVLEASRDRRPGAKLLVFGCMAKRFKDDILTELPEIDYIVPSTNPQIVVDFISRELGVEVSSSEKRAVSTPGYVSYLKIAEGCDKSCTYCVIPKIRGRFKSVPMEELLAEARFLAENGTRELILVAQESCSYGKDLYGEKSLHKLMQGLSEIEGIKWIRLLYAYPEEIYDELIDIMASNPKICHYIDMPIQHGDDGILRRMGRATDNASIASIISKLRGAMPDISIRTTMITGFPGESEQAHRNLLDFISRMKFDNLGAFLYSREEGSPAYDFPDQIDEETKQRRYDEIMSLQQSIVTEINEKHVGKEFKCIVEGRLIEEGVYQGRTFQHAPDIDGVVFFESNRDLISGDFVNIKITENRGYDLKGELI